MIRPEEAARPLTVTELAQEIKRQLRPLASVLVKGEVSGMKRTAGGHYGFAIKDRGSLVNAFLFADDARRLALVPEDGQEFVFRGRVDFWPQGGQLRLIVDYVQFDDVGRLRAQLERLKQRLEAQGAFEPGRKRPLPFLPRAVALVTSPTGAVIHDLQETIRDRYPNMEILVYPAQVQGTASPGSVVAAIRRCNQEARAQVVVIARGGGSFEELYAFNTEPVARAILASRIPVVTALGHTSDRTVADLVADAECRTPTEAGARVVPRKAELAARLADRRRRLDLEVRRRLAAESDRLESRGARLAALNPARLVELQRNHLAGLIERLRAASQRTIRLRSAELESRRAGARMERALQDRLRAAESAIAQRRRRLEALSPERVLSRGYSITTNESGRVLRSAAETAVGRAIRVRLDQGVLAARVEEAAQ